MKKFKHTYVVRNYDTIVIIYDNIIDGIVINLTCDTCKGNSREKLYLTFNFNVSSLIHN